MTPQQQTVLMWLNVNEKYMSKSSSTSQSVGNALARVFFCPMYMYSPLGHKGESKQRCLGRVCFKHIRRATLWIRPSRFKWQTLIFPAMLRAGSFRRQAPRKSPDYSAGRALENFLLAENRKAFTTAQKETLNVIVSAATSGIAKGWSDDESQRKQNRKDGHNKYDQCINMQKP